MSIFGIHIISSDKLKALKASAKDFALSEADKVVATLKQTHIGAVAIQAVNDVESKSLSGLQKLEAVVADVAPLIVEYAAGGGITAAVSDAEALARQLVQSVYVDVKKSSIGSLVKSLLKLLNI